MSKIKLGKRMILLCVVLISTIELNAQFRHSLYDLRCNALETPLGIDQETIVFSWKSYSEGRNYNQHAYQVMVVRSSDGKEVWNSGKIISPNSIYIPYEGRKLKSSTQYRWKVRTWAVDGQESRWSQEALFETGLFSENDWKQARWIAFEADRRDWHVVPAIHQPSVQNEIEDKNFGSYKMPKFRRKFELSKTLKKATTYVCGLGHFDLYINEKKVGENFLDPGWTKYDKEALYVTFDITDYLQKQNNEVKVMLGNGFYNIPRKGYYKIVGSFGAPKLRMLIRLEYEDGSVENIITDQKWQVAESPVRFSSIYSGEEYDARYENMPWSEVVLSSYSGKLKSQQEPPLRIRQKLQVQKFFKNSKGDWVYDLGQNFSGIISVKMRGGEGEQIVFRPAELINQDNSVNQSASGDPFCFRYTLKGEEKEQWQPQFTYYGFRYIQLEGAVPQGEPNPYNLPVVEELVGLHTASSAPEAGSFVCSYPLFNQIYTLIDWAMRSNMASVLTDCPHREKLGWLEEAHLMQYSLQYRYNLHTLYPKLMNDMQASQTGNGNIPTIAPEYVRFGDGFEDTPEWGSAFIISPWYIYKWYGDKSLIEKYYPAMQRMQNYLTSRADEEGIVAYGLGDWYDIGPNHPGVAQLTSNGVTATAIYYYNALILGKMAQLLGKEEDLSNYSEMAEKIKTSFNRRFYNQATGIYDRNSQTANAMALFMGLVPKEKEELILSNLIGDIRSRGNALTAGDVGYRYVLQTLQKSDSAQVIYDMNSRYDVPGYGWQLAHGATALTESWQAYGFVSNNHFMLGHLMEWLFGGLGGIRQTEESIAWKEVLIAPQIVGDITYANTTYTSPYGKINCQWKLHGNRYTLEIDIPANSGAIVVLPVNNANCVTESGTRLEHVNGVLSYTVEGDNLNVKVGSGHYMFTVSK